MSIHFTDADKAGLLALAVEATGSEGFMADARPLAAFDQGTGDLLAIVVFQNLTTISAEIHFVGIVRGWPSRRLLTGLYRIAFDRMGVRYLRAPIPEWNVPAQVLAIKSGFRWAGRVPGGALGASDAITFSMDRSQCRWLLPGSARDATPADHAG